jgi:hypothetical protein
VICTNEGRGSTAPDNVDRPEDIEGDCRSPICDDGSPSSVPDDGDAPTGGHQCCSDGGPVSNVPESFAQVENDSTCPNRQQNTSRPPLPGTINTGFHLVDGCSLPGRGDGLLDELFFQLLPVYSGNADDPVSSEIPGIDTEFGRPEGPVRMESAPLFDLPCNKHDVCYQTCGSNRGACDGQLTVDLTVVCNRAYEQVCPQAVRDIGTIQINGDPVDACERYMDERAACFTAVTVFATALEEFGDTAYEERQVQFCNCCNNDAH